MLSACVVLTLAALTFVFWIEPDPGDSAPHRSQLDQLLERRDSIYDNLRDLKFENRAGKYAEQDYEQMRDALENEAAQVLLEIEECDRKPGADAAPGSGGCREPSSVVLSTGLGCDVQRNVSPLARIKDNSFAFVGALRAERGKLESVVRINLFMKTWLIGNRLRQCARAIACLRRLPRARERSRASFTTAPMAISLPPVSTSC